MGGSTGDKGKEGLPIPGVFMGLKVKVVDDKVVVEIVRKWEQSIMGSGACVL